MTRMLPTLAILLATVEPLAALESRSTMADWATASASDRDALLEALGPSLSQSFRTDKAEILACLDRAGQSAGHAEIPVSTIAKACAEAARPDGQPTPSNDI